MNRYLIKSFSIYVLLFLFASHIQGQEVNVDSLFAIWSDTTRHAEERVEVFYQRFHNSAQNEAENPEAARWSYGIMEVQELAREIGKTEYLGLFQLLEGGTYVFFTGEIDLDFGQKSVY